MTTQPARKLRVTLEDEGGGVARAVWTLSRFRFLLSDGRTLDVISERDDSELRGAVLLFTKADRIEGVATMPLPEPEPKAVPRKRALKRGATPIPS